MKKGRIFWGTMLVVASLLLVGDMLNVLPKGINWFSFTLTTLFIVIAISSLVKRKISQAVMPLTFATMLNMNHLGLTGSIWTVLLIGFLLSVGLSLILKESFVITGFNDHDRVFSAQGNSNMKITSVFGTRTHHVTSTELRFLEIESVFGGLDLYLDKANIVDGATIKIDNVFAGTRLYFSRDVNVVSQVSNVFGGTKHKERGLNGCGSTIRINGDNVFGGIEIIYI